MKRIAILFAALLVVALPVFAGPAEQLIGEWQGGNKKTVVEFRRDGTLLVKADGTVFITMKWELVDDTHIAYTHNSKRAVYEIARLTASEFVTHGGGIGKITRPSKAETSVTKLKLGESLEVGAVKLTFGHVVLAPRKGSRESHIFLCYNLKNVTETKVIKTNRGLLLRIGDATDEFGNTIENLDVQRLGGFGKPPSELPPGVVVDTEKQESSWLVQTPAVVEYKVPETLMPQKKCRQYAEFAAPPIAKAKTFTTEGWVIIDNKGTRAKFSLTFTRDDFAAQPEETTTALMMTSAKARSAAPSALVKLLKDTPYFVGEVQCDGQRLSCKLIIFGYNESTDALKRRLGNGFGALNWTSLKCITSLKGSIEERSGRTMLVFTENKYVTGRAVQLGVRYELIEENSALVGTWKYGKDEGKIKLMPHRSGTTKQ